MKKLFYIHGLRWTIRGIVGLMIVAGALPALREAGVRRVIAPASLLAAGALVYVTNFRMAAERMFVAPTRY